MSNDKSKLSHEDRIIWARIARTVDAFPGKQIPEDDWFALEPPAPQRPNPPLKPARTAQSSTGAAVPPRHQPQPIEKPVVRKLAKGRLPIDGRIDLHGLTQSEAIKEMSAVSEGLGDMSKQLAAQAALGREQYPADLVGTVVFLASTDSDFITGQNFTVDGGVAHW